MTKPLIKDVMNAPTSERIEESQALLLLVNDLRSKVSELDQKLNSSIRGVRLHCAGKYTTTGGGTTESLEIAGVVKGMMVFAMICGVGGAPVTVTASVCQQGQVNFTFSADPSNDHVVHYMVVH